MSRITPQYQDKKQSVPKWINPSELKQASAPEIKQDSNVKTANTQSAAVVVSHGCTNCGKTFSNDNADIRAQFVLAQRKASIEGRTLSSVVLNCPSCGGALAEYSRTGVSTANISSRQAATYVSGTQGAVSTILDRHMTYKAAQALEVFAAKMGMSLVRARILNFTRHSSEGSTVPLTSSVDCELEWTIAPRLKTRVFATVGIDNAGKIRMPRVFKTADHKEYPFTEETIEHIEKSADIFKTPPEPRLKKTDVPQYRKSDPTRFRAASAKEGMSANDIIHEAYQTATQKMQLSQADSVHLAKFVSLSKNATSKGELVALAKNIFGETDKGVGGLIFQHLSFIQESDDEKLAHSLLAAMPTEMMIVCPTCGFKGLSPTTHDDSNADFKFSDPQQFSVSCPVCSTSFSEKEIAQLQWDYRDSKSNPKDLTPTQPESLAPSRYTSKVEGEQGPPFSGKDRS